MKKQVSIMGIKDFFNKLFGFGQNTPSGKNFSDAYYPPKQAIRLIKTAEPHISKFGGKPNLPDSIPWPETPEGYEMDFIAQIHFPEVPAGFGLPDSGTLFVFYDTDVHPWGVDEEDCNYWKIIYTEEKLPENQRERTSVPFPSETEFYDVYEAYYKEKFLTFEIFISRAGDAEEFGEEEGQHQMLGYPLYIQDEEMEPGYELLLQIDCDDDVMFSWGDCGRLFFWIKPEDLTAKRFDNLKFFLDSH